MRDFLHCVLLRTMVFLSVEALDLVYLSDESLTWCFFSNESLAKDFAVPGFPPPAAFAPGGAKG